MDPNTEIAHLRAEVAELKQQMAVLRSFFTIGSSVAEPERKTLSINCESIRTGGLTVARERNSEANTLQLESGKKGPYISFWGSNSKARMILKLINDRPDVCLWNTNRKAVITMGETEEGWGQVGVLHDGQPRAIMKGLPENGAVAALHDDGHVRACLSSKAEHGEVFVIGTDMQKGVEMSSNGLHGGGYLSVNHTNGKTALMLGSTNLGGGVMSRDPEGNVLAAWPTMRDAMPEDGAEEE